MSSGDAILHSAASIGVRDGLSKFLPEKYNADEKQRYLIRILVIAISLVAYYFAIISEIPIVNLLLGSYGGVAQIFPLVFCMFYWKRANRYGALSGLSGGIAVTLLFLFFPEWRPVPIHEGIYGLFANISLIVAVSLLTVPESEQRLNRYEDA
jgi:SSS family solute:Na+ symporter